MGRAKNEDGSLKLTEKEESLCWAALDTDNQSDALRASKYQTDNMNPLTINKRASQMFQLPHIRGRVAELKEERNKRCEINSDYVLNRTVEIDQLDLLDIMNDDLSVKPLSEWPSAWRRTVSSIEVVEEFAGTGGDKQSVGWVKKLRLPDKVKNLEMLGRHVDVQAWKDKSEVDVNVNLTIGELARQIGQERVVN